MQALRQLQEIFKSLSQFYHKFLFLLQRITIQGLQESQKQRSASSLTRIQSLINKYFDFFSVQLMTELNSQISLFEQFNRHKVQQQLNYLKIKELISQSSICPQLFSCDRNFSEQDNLFLTHEQISFSSLQKVKQVVYQESQSSFLRVIQQIQIKNLIQQRGQSNYIIQGLNIIDKFKNEVLKAENKLELYQTVSFRQANQLNQTFLINRRGPVQLLGQIIRTQKIDMNEQQTQTQKRVLGIQKLQANLEIVQFMKKRKTQRTKDEIQIQLESLIFGKQLIPFIQYYMSKVKKNQIQNQQTNSAPYSSATGKQVKNQYIQGQINPGYAIKKSQLISFLTRSKQFPQLSIDDINQAVSHRLVIILFDTLLYVLKTFQFFLPPNYLAQLVGRIKNEQASTLKAAQLKQCQKKIRKSCEEVMKVMKNLKKRHERQQKYSHIFDLNSKIQIRMK